MPKILLTLFLVLQNYLAAGQVELKVMTFNAWHDWSQVNDGFKKAEAAIRESKADVVGLQESSPKSAERMAEALGWQWAEGGSGSVQILSRFPIVESLSGIGIGRDRIIGARIRVDGETSGEVVIFNTHLDYLHYGPYAAREKKTTVEVVIEENARSKRVSQISAVLTSMKEYLAEADAVPVFLTGDFNVPSHLDWTTGTADRHHGLGPVVWPETSLVVDVGMADSFRTAHPDPVAEPGITWSAIHKDDEPQDRIDFVFYKGKSLHVVESKTFTTAVERTIGEWGADKSAVEGNTWPSDHSAVLTTFFVSFTQSAETD